MITLSIESDAVIQVDGVRITVAVLDHLFTNPPTDRLLALRRDGDHVIVESFFTPAAAAEYFEKLNARPLCGIATEAKPGWRCTRHAGHEGPCAAEPI